MKLTRRDILKATFATALCGAVPSFARASLPQMRQLHFHNIHTGESLKTVYWEKGVYDTDALAAIARVLRDHRTGDVRPMDISLLDLIESLHQRLESNRPFEVISGYRSPQSNAMLHEHTSGVAVGSMHMYGKAIDIRLGDRSTTDIRDMALSMKAGGVGYYATSDFVHVDTGSVRHW